LRSYLRLDDHVKRGSGGSGPHRDGAQGTGEVQEGVFGHDGIKEERGRRGGERRI
jgi:hypothetical protein